MVGTGGGCHYWVDSSAHLRGWRLDGTVGQGAGEQGPGAYEAASQPKPSQANLADGGSIRADRDKEGKERHT